MAQKYAVYRLEKVKGKKEYIVTTTETCNSLKDAYHALECWEEDLPECPWYNQKTGEFVCYEIHDRLLYVPNWTETEDGEFRLIGAVGYFPIYYIDKYPNNISYYKLHKIRGLNEITLEGVK